MAMDDFCIIVFASMGVNKGDAGIALLVGIRVEKAGGKVTHVLFCLSLQIDEMVDEW